jgi:SAM-dependent methyltransferase
MIEILNYCNQELIKLPCCHGRETNLCNCYNCLHDGFYSEDDTYTCFKKLCYYVINYGPSYASEIYHHLSTSKILEAFNNNKTIKVLSLGCGYSPDLIILNKYIRNNDLNIKINYTGIDQSSQWNSLRLIDKSTAYYEVDLLNGFDFSDYDLVFIIKLFSTLYKDSSVAKKFIDILINQIRNNFKSGGHLIFNDINSIHMGRDMFHSNMVSLFSECKQYYFDSPPYKELHWIKIPYDNIVVEIPDDLKVSPLREIRQTIVFDYKK